ncbi:MAG TPA: hypothetical protein VFA89_20185 [Terriglobales bacterium]|nr:hypothetical protein [Terriglobales bacterium]
MQSLNVVLFQSDTRVAQAVASSLSAHFASVHVVTSPQELHSTIAKFRARLVIVDLELSRLSIVERLHKEFPAISIVCTHRIADEEMWAAVLAAGGDDILPAHDTHGILQSALRNAAMARSAAA